MTYNEFLEHIKGIDLGTSNFAPIYFLIGKDDYIVEKVKKALLQFVDADYRDFNYSEFTQESFSDAIDSLYTFPMFSSLRMVYMEISNSSELEKIQSSIADYLKNPSDTSILVVDATKLEKPFAGIKNDYKVVCEFDNDRDRYVEIENLCKEKPSREIESQACIELNKRTQGDMYRIISELNKLKAYTDQAITKQDVIDMVSADLDYKLYEIAGFVSAKNTEAALQSLQVLIQNGFSAIAIFNALYDKYRMMLHVSLHKDMRNDEICKYFGVKEGAIFFARNESEAYSQVKLKKCVDYIHGLLFEIVYGNRQQDSALYEAILQLIAL